MILLYEVLIEIAKFIEAESKWNGVCQGKKVEENGELLFNKHKVLVWKISFHDLSHILVLIVSNAYTHRKAAKRTNFMLNVLPKWKSNNFKWFRKLAYLSW